MYNYSENYLKFNEGEKKEFKIVFKNNIKKIYDKFHCDHKK